MVVSIEKRSEPEVNLHSQRGQNYDSRSFAIRRRLNRGFQGGFREQRCASPGAASVSRRTPSRHDVSGRLRTQSRLPGTNMCYGALHVCLAAALLYIAKWRIIRSGASWSVAILAYAFVVALLLPYVWLRVIYPLTYSAWFACPLLVYPLPTTTFLAIDLWSDGQTARIYWSRTCVELLILAMIAVGWWHYWAHHGGIIAPGLPW